VSWHDSCWVKRINDLLYRILSKCFLGALLALAMGTEARALSITPATANIMTFDETSESKILAEINSNYLGVVLAYKQNVGGSEEGPFACLLKTERRRSHLARLNFNQGKRSSSRRRSHAYAAWNRTYERLNYPTLGSSPHQVEPRQAR
jgi:hypothetical protein